MERRDHKTQSTHPSASWSTYQKYSACPSNFPLPGVANTSIASSYSSTAKPDDHELPDSLLQVLEYVKGRYEVGPPIHLGDDPEPEDTVYDTTVNPLPITLTQTRKRVRKHTTFLTQRRLQRYRSHELFSFLQPESLDELVTAKLFNVSLLPVCQRKIDFVRELEMWQHREFQPPNITYNTVSWGCGGTGPGVQGHCLVGWTGLGILIYRHGIWNVNPPHPSHAWSPLPVGYLYIDYGEAPVLQLPSDFFTRTLYHKSLRLYLILSLLQSRVSCPGTWSQWTRNHRSALSSSSPSHL